MKMREHNSQIVPQQSTQKCGSPERGSPERGSPERGATLLEVGLATALIAIALVGLSQIYASRNEFRQDQAESGFFHILAKEVEARASVSKLIADLSEGESRILNSAGLLEAGLISELEKTSFHIQGEEMEALLFVTKGRGSAFRLALGLAAMGDWTLDDEKAEALQRFLTLASFEGGYFRKTSGAGGLRPMMDPDRAMTAADRTRPLWLDYADALTDQKALADSTIPVTELETGRYSEGKILAVLSGTKTSALEGGRSVRLRESPLMTGSKTTKRIAGDYTGRGEWLNPFKMPLSYNLAKRLAEGWKLELMLEGDTVEDLSVSPVTCAEGERAVAIAAPKDLYANFLGDSDKSATKKLAGAGASVESDSFLEPNVHCLDSFRRTTLWGQLNCPTHRLTSGVAGYEETSTNLFEMQRAFPEEMFDAASLADLSEADKANLRRQMEERYGVDYAHRPYGAYAGNGFTAGQEGFGRKIDGSKAARNISFGLHYMRTRFQTPALERTITASSPLRMNGVIRLADGSYVAGKGKGSDLTENGGLSLGLIYDKAQLSDSQAEALLTKLRDKEGFIKRVWKNFDNSRTDRMAARYQAAYKYWCSSLSGVPSNLCDRLAATLSGSHASYLAEANSLISEIEAARLAYTEAAQAQLTALESSNINGGRIVKQSGRFYFNSSGATPANLPATGTRGHYRILPSNQAMSASDSRTGQWLYDRMCLEAYRTIRFRTSEGRWNTSWTRRRDYSAACGRKNALSMMNLAESVFPLDGLTQGTINAIKNRSYSFNTYRPSYRGGGGHLGLKAERDTSGSGWHILSLVNGYFFSTAATTAQLNQMVTDQNSIASAYGTTRTRLETLRYNAGLNLAKLREARDNRWKVSRNLDRHLFHKLALDALKKDPALASAFEEKAVHMANGASEPKLTALHALGDTEGDATSVARPRHVIPVALNHFKRQMECDVHGACSPLNAGTGSSQFRPERRGIGIYEEGRTRWLCARPGGALSTCLPNEPNTLHHVARPGHGGRSHTAGMEVIYPDNLIHKKAVCVPVAPADAP